jgi:hypothetical protein
VQHRFGDEPLHLVGGDVGLAATGEADAFRAPPSQPLRAKVGQKFRRSTLLRTEEPRLYDQLYDQLKLADVGTSLGNSSRLN